MKLTDISNDINEWFDGSGPLADIVISSRIRLARNLAGHKFLSRCSNTEKAEILKKLRDVMMALELGDKVFYVSVDKAPPLNRHFLVEWPNWQARLPALPRDLHGRGQGARHRRCRPS